MSASEPKKTRAVSHFRRNALNDRHTLPVDMIETIACSFLNGNGRVLRLLMMCNKQLRQKIMSEMSIWVNLYRDWAAQGAFGYIPKSVPNIHYIRRRCSIQPQNIKEFDAKGVPEGREQEFVNWMLRVNALSHQSRCPSKCFYSLPDITGYNLYFTDATDARVQGKRCMRCGTCARATVSVVCTTTSFRIR
jgi:hypothetical protein